MGFDESAKRYLASRDHAVGDDLGVVRSWIDGASFDLLVDVATAAGHMAANIDAAVKVGIDISPNMLATARAAHGILPCLGAAEALPVRESAADILTCRIALHHFADPAAFFKEVHRVLRPGGVFILIDSIVDDEDNDLNRIELVRDASHVRSRTFEEMLAMSAGMFRLERYHLQHKRHEFTPWAARLGADAAQVRIIEEAFLDLPDAIKRVLKVEVAGGRVISYTDKKGIFSFGKRHQ